MKSLNFLNSKINMQTLLSPATQITALCFFLLLTLVACKKDTQTAISPDSDSFVQMAQSFIQKANLPVSIETVNTENEVLQAFDAARQIIDESVFIKTDADGVVSYNKVKESNELTEAQKDDAAQKLVDQNLITKGDYIFRAEWSFPGGGTFFTLGTISADGVPKFEPILYFNGTYESFEPNPMQRGWDWGEFNHNVNNGFGMQAVEVSFKVHIATDPDNCLITDPAPHIEITKAAAKIPLWTQKTTKGELYWCNPKNNCECRYGSTVPAEECLKFAVVTLVASGFSGIEVEAGGAGKVGGVDLEAKIKFNASSFGSEITMETIRSICASGSTP